MRQSWVLALVFLVGVSVTVRDARAQSAAPPVEVGLDVSTTIVPERSGVQRGPRLVVNVDGRNAVQFTARLQKLAPWEDYEQETDLYLAAYRRLVHAAGPVRVYATLGGGLERTVIVTPAVTFGNPPITFPSTRGVEVLPAFTSGAAFDVRVASHAAVVIESSFVLTDRLGGRLSAGLVVPIGSYPSRSRLASSVPWAQLDAGERAWITTVDGREVDGEVARRSADTLALRTRTGIVSLAVNDVRAIDTTDPIRNGTVLGAKIGTVGALVPAVFATLGLCLSEQCGVDDVLLINGILVGIGAGVGAATGALADSLRERRVPLYRRGASTSVTFAPIVGRHRMGGGAVIRW